jgi:hypothetical protein
MKHSTSGDAPKQPTTFLRTWIAPFLRQQGFTGSGGAYRREESNGIWSILAFTRPKWLAPDEAAAFYVNAGLVVPRLRAFESTRYGVPPMGVPGIADCVLTATLGRHELGGMEPVLWSIPKSEDEQSELATYLSGRLLGDVFPGSRSLARSSRFAISGLT